VKQSGNGGRAGLKPRQSAHLHFRWEVTAVITEFLRDESGMELSEYAVAAALVTIAVVFAFTALGKNVKGVITNLANNIK
jgi:pilus assembly protein Flp/PilA